MRIAFLASGLMGGKLGTILARAGHDVIFSYSRNRQKLERLAKDAGIRAHVGTPAEATQDADAVLLAVHWMGVDDELAQAGALLRSMLPITCPRARLFMPSLGVDLHCAGQQRRNA